MIGRGALYRRYFGKLWSTQGKVSSLGSHFLDHKKLNMSTERNSRLGSGDGGGSGGGGGRGEREEKEEGGREGRQGWSWRDVVEYGLKGTAVSLLIYSSLGMFSPWSKASERARKNLEASVEQGSRSTSSKTSKAFSGAKCATSPPGAGEGGEGGGGIRLSQRYNFLAEAVERAAPSVVFIEKSEPVETFFGRQMSVSTGSGFIVSEDGYVMTNAHVVGSARSVKVKLASGKVLKGEVTDLDQVADLALLKLQTRDKLPVLEFGSSAGLRPGEWVVALGSPLSLSNTITAGIVSSCHRPSKELGIHRGGLDLEYIQTDAAITIGNSGGPLVNLDGEVIGVNTLTAGPGISFAIPSDFAREFVTRANKTPRKSTTGPYVVGISMLTVTPDLAPILQHRGTISEDVEHGVLVAQVWPSSVAARAGLKKGDVIVKINGEEVTTSQQVFVHVQSGKKLNVEVLRNSSRRMVTLSPEKM